MSFLETNSPFTIISPVLPYNIPANESIFVQIRFTPQIAGTVVDSLFIYNNSLNMPVAKFRISGTGIVASPRPPQNPCITMNGFDVTLSWDPVTVNMLDLPITPDYYFIYNSDNPNGVYLYVGASQTSSFTHPMVALGAGRMFYKVTTVKFYRNDISPADMDSYFRDNLRAGMNDIEVQAVLDNYYGLFQASDYTDYSE